MSIKFCIIGCGRMGRRHILAVKELGHAVVGVYDHISATTQIAIDEKLVSREQIFSSAKEMLTQSKPDAVIIASTGPSHFEYALMASEMGVQFILCEKPLASSIEQCHKIAEVCKKNKTILAVNHQMRFMEQYTKVKDLIETRGFGEIASVNVIASNFGLAMNGTHYFEMFRFICNEEIEHIQFWKDDEKVPNPRGVEFEDFSGQIRANTKSGKRFFMEIGGDLGHGLQVIYSCRNGHIFVDELTGHLRATVRKPEFADLPTTRYGMPADLIEMTIEPASVIGPTQKVIEAMLNQNDYPDISCGIHAVQALVAAHESSFQSSKLVNLKQISNPEKIYSWA